MRFSEFINEKDIVDIGISLLNWEDTDEKMLELERFLSYLFTSGRSPKGKKEQYENLKALKKMVELYKQFNYVPQPVGATIQRWDANYIRDLVKTFSVSKQDTIEIDKILYKNESKLSEKKFLEMVDVISNLLNRISGEHRKSLWGDVIFVFKERSQMNSKAKYVFEKDEIWINEASTKYVGRELYGWLPYIVIHELAHRYDRKYGLPKWFNGNKYRTTKYSYEGFGDEEVFAEVFALSFFGDKIHSDFDNYSDVVNTFRENFEK